MVGPGAKAETAPSEKDPSLPYLGLGFIQSRLPLLDIPEVLFIHLSHLLCADLETLNVVIHLTLTISL